MNDQPEQKLKLYFMPVNLLSIEYELTYTKNTVLMLGLKNPDTKEYLTFGIGSRVLTDPRNVYELPTVTEDLRQKMSKLAWLNVESNLNEVSNPKNRDKIFKVPLLPDNEVQELAKLDQIQTDIMSAVNPWLLDIEQQQLLLMTDANLKKWAKGFLKRLEGAIFDKRIERGIKGKNRVGFLSTLKTYLDREALKLKGDVKYNVIPMKKDAAAGAREALTVANATSRSKKRMFSNAYQSSDSKTVAETNRETEAALNDAYKHCLFANEWSGLDISLFCAAISFVNKAKAIRNINKIAKNKGEKPIFETGYKTPTGELTTLKKKEVDKDTGRSVFSITPENFLQQAGLKATKINIDSARESLKKLSAPRDFAVIRGDKKYTIENYVLMNFTAVKIQNKTTGEEIGEKWVINHINNRFDFDTFKGKTKGGFFIPPMALIQNINENCDPRQTDSMIRAVFMIFLDLNRVYDHKEAQAKQEAKAKQQRLPEALTATLSKSICDLGFNRVTIDKSLEFLIKTLQLANLSAEITGESKNTLTISYTKRLYNN